MPVFCIKIAIIMHKESIFQTKKYKVAAAFLLMLSLCMQISPIMATPSQKTIQATRDVVSNPTNETVNKFVKMMLKEYRKENRAGNYEEAADYLRSALYFLKQSPSDRNKYQDTLEKLNKIVEEQGLDTSQASRLELAKSLYLEGKYFASGYEISNLLKEEYEVDLCYEYLGDISKKLNQEDVSFAFYKKAVETNPDNLSAKYKYANALLKQGKDTDAIYYFEEVIENTNSEAIINEIINNFMVRANNDPNNENNYGILGLAYQKLGQYDKTYQLLKKSLMINPNDIFLQYYLGNLLFEVKEYSFADEIYSEILEDNPYESQIRISRAKAYLAMGDYDKAIKDYQIVLAMYPDSLQAQYGLYCVLKNRLPLDKIINLFYPIEPDYKLKPDGYDSLGYFANKLGNSKDAVIFFEKSLSQNPKSETPYIELYKLYQLLGQNDKAKNILQKGYKLFPKNEEIIELYSALNSDKVDEKNNLALSYLNEGEYQKAITIYNQIEPKTAATYEAIGNCYRQLGDFSSAVNNYNKSLSINPDNSEAYYALGITYLEANNLKKAKEAFEISLKKDSKNIKSKKMLSFIEQKEVIKSIDLAYNFYEKKDYRSALKYLNKAVQTFPNDPKVYYYRGLTKESLGDIKGAVDDFRETVKIDRNYYVAYFKLAESLEKIGKQKEALFMYEKYLGAEDIDKNLMKKAEQRVLDLGAKYY